MQRINFKRVIAVLTAATMSGAYIIPAMAQDKDEKAPREYVVSEFVQSVGRNNLMIKAGQTNKILAAFNDSEDISEDYKDDIARAKAYNLVAGYEDGTLRPRENVRRIEAMVLLSRALPDEIEETGGLIEFTDVPEWAKADIDRLTKAGLVYGYGDGTLGAEDEITVGQVKMLTDRSDEALNTTPVGDSFYGYANNKTFRNHNVSDSAKIDPIHGVVIQTPNSWSTFSERAAEVSNITRDTLHKIIKGEIVPLDSTPEQRVRDMYYCYVNKEEDAGKDAEMFTSYRDRLLNAETTEDFIKEANAIYKETGVNVLYDVQYRTDTDEHITYPYVTLTAPNYAAKILFDNKNAEHEKKYEEVFGEYAKLFGDRFTDNDIKEAIKLQKSILVNKDYYDNYKEFREFRASRAQTYDAEALKEELNAILNQHPLIVERRANEDKNIAQGVAAPIKLTPKEANALNDIKIASLMEEAGYEAPKYMLLDNGDDKIYKDTKLTKSNLNAFKLNAALKLSEDLNYAPSKEEQEMLWKFDNLVEGSVFGIDYSVVEQALNQNMSAQDTLSNNAGGEKTEDEIIDDNLKGISKLMKNDIGMVFARQEFSNEDLSKIGDMFGEIITAYGELFGTNEWMDDKTKLGAFAKLANMVAVIGYPDNYGFANITSREDGGTYAKNLIAIKLDEKDRLRQTFSDPEFVRTMMYKPADEINAFYVPNFNTVNIFAGISGGAMYDKSGTPARNLGALGSILGHEIGHAFDAGGAKFNEKGEYKNWWSDKCADYFETLKQKFVDYYKNFEVTDGVVQDSEITITENMADFAGMSAVMEALKGDKEAQKEALEAYARTYARVGDQSVVTSTSFMTDVHSSGNVRVDAVVASLPEFYELYDVKEGDKMYIQPEDRLKLW